MEFLHVDDLADACVFLMKNYSDDEHVNVGSGSDVTILELTEMVARAVGFDGAIVRNESKPDGTPRKLMSGSKLQSMGWHPAIAPRTASRPRIAGSWTTTARHD